MFAVLTQSKSVSLQDSRLLSPASSVADIPGSNDMSPQDFAVALTILEGEVYEKILPADYIACIRRLPGNRVDKASEINKRIVVWVKQTLLKPETISARAAVMQFFIVTAQVCTTAACNDLANLKGTQECRHLRNFESMAAIVDGLQSSTVSRLWLTREELGTELRHVFSVLGRVLEPNANHQMYRSALRESKAEAIPWIGALFLSTFRVQAFS